MPGETTEIAVKRSEPATTSLLNFVAQAVSDPNVDVAKLEALLRMQREIVADQARVEFNVALHAAQSEMPRVKKNGTINLVRDGRNLGALPFATWEDVDTALRPIMNKYGFSLSFDQQERTVAGGGGTVTGTLLHVAGHSKTASMSLPLDTGPGRNNLQAAGSTLSYAKRYIAEMLFNIVREKADDDGRAGGTRYVTEEQAAELRELLRDAGRQEGPFLDRLFTGTVRSLDEVETGAYVVVKNSLLMIINQKQKGGKA